MSERVQVPKEQLRQGRKRILEKVRKQRKRRKQLQVSAAGLAVAILLFTFSIRVSPAFANYVAKIPGFEPFVELVAFDKGIEDMLANDYFEEIGESVTSPENNVTLTVVGVAADYSGLSIAYTLNAPFDLSKEATPNIEIRQGNKPIQAGFSYGWAHEEESRYVEDIIQLTLHNGMDYSNRDFELVFTFTGEKAGTVRVPFTLEQEILQPKLLAENQTLTFENQSITFKKIEVSPLRATLTIEIDEDNTMQILSFEDLKLVDEYGEEWSAIRNGVSATGSTRDDEYVIYIQSNYFREPKQLKLEIGAVTALPKGEDYIIVDFEKDEIIHKPSYEELTFKVDYRTVTVKGHYPETGGKSVLMSALDADGVEHYGGSHEFEHDENELEERISFDGTVASPAKLPIMYYPNVIAKNVEVQLK